MYCLLFILDLQSINISNVLMKSEAMTMLHTDKLCTVAFLRLMYVTPNSRLNTATFGCIGNNCK